MTDDSRNAEALALATAWGFLWASVLQFTEAGRWVAKERTWVAVVVGVGGDLLIARGAMDRHAWEAMAGIVAASSVGIVLRSLYNEMTGTERG